MRILVSAILALASMSAPAAASTTPERVTYSFRSKDQQLLFANRKCAWSVDGLPSSKEEWRPLVLMHCWPDSSQQVTFEQGKLLMGDGVAQIAPAPLPKDNVCYAGQRTSGKRLYDLAICYNDRVGPEGISDVADDVPTHRYRVVYGPETRTWLRGHPVFVSRVSASAPAQPYWEYLPNRQLFRLRGTDLCITPPTGDLSLGAPLTLDFCGAPTVSGGAADESAGRQRVRPAPPWRTS